MAEKKIVVVCVDPTQEGDSTLKWAATNFLETERHKIHIISIIEDIPNIAFYAPSQLQNTEYLQQLQTKTKNASQLILQNHGKYLERELGKKVEYELILGTGEAKDEIVDYTYKCNADILVVGSRGLGVLKRSFLGSTSDYCAHNCKCPVIIVKKEGSNQ